MSNKLHKNVIKFLPTKDSRPILKGLHFSSDGNIYGTDSYVGIKLEGYNQSKSEFILDPRSLETLEGNYPDLNRMFTIDPLHDVSFNQTMINQLLLFLKPHKNKQADCVFTKNQLVITIEHMETVLTVPYQSTDDFTITLNTTYLTNAFQLYKDEKIDIVMHLTSSLRPIIIKGENIHVIITPIRKG